MEYGAVCSRPVAPEPQPALSFALPGRYLLGVSKRTLEQWEQGRREPSGAAKQLLKIAERHPEVLIEVAA